MITQKLIENIMASRPDIDAKTIYINLKEVEETRTLMEKYILERDLECKKHKEVLSVIAAKIIALQKKCPHWTKTYHPDPSGNNDSFYTCDICDKTL